MIENVYDAKMISLHHASKFKSIATVKILDRIYEAAKNNKWRIIVSSNELDSITFDYLANNGFKLIGSPIVDTYIISWSL